MNKYPWFRLYTESRNDSKLDALNDREFRIWHKLLCLAAESEERGTIDYIDPEFVAMELRLGVDELDSAISRMVRLRLVERSETKVIFKAFAARQWDKPSDMPDSVKERVRRHRAKSGSNADVTRSNANETRRTEQIQIKTEGVQGENGTPVDNSSDPQHIADIIAEAKKNILRGATQ